MKKHNAWLNKNNAGFSRVRKEFTAPVEISNLGGQRLSLWEEARGIHAGLCELAEREHQVQIERVNDAIKEKTEMYLAHACLDWVIATATIDWEVFGSKKVTLKLPGIKNARQGRNTPMVPLHALEVSKLYVVRVCSDLSDWHQESVKNIFEKLTRSLSLGRDATWRSRLVELNGKQPTREAYESCQRLLVCGSNSRQFSSKKVDTVWKLFHDGAEQLKGNLLKRAAKRLPKQGVNVSPHCGRTSALLGHRSARELADSESPSSPRPSSGVR